MSRVYNLPKIKLLFAYIICGGMKRRKVSTRVQVFIQSQSQSDHLE